MLVIRGTIAILIAPEIVRQVAYRNLGGNCVVVGSSLGSTVTNRQGPVQRYLLMGRGAFKRYLHKWRSKKLAAAQV